MPQPFIFLDPRQPKASRTWVPPAGRVFPPKVKKFGFVPDPDQLRPGDLILFNSLEPDFISRGIVRVQTRAGFPEQHARWHHAAMYIDDLNVCEAELTGVCFRPLHQDLDAKTCIRVRRPDFAALSNRSGLSEGQLRFNLVVAAMTRLGNPYGFEKIRRLFLSAKASYWNIPDRLGTTSSQVCSELYAEAYLKATNELATPGVLDIPTPAHLSQSTSLVDVRVDWVEIGDNFYSAP